MTPKTSLNSDARRPRLLNLEHHPDGLEPRTSKIGLNSERRPLIPDSADPLW